MATQYRGIDLGESYTDVDAGTSTTSSNVEISFNDAVILDRLELVKLLENLIIYIEQTDFPS